MYIIWNFFKDAPEYDLGPMTRNQALIWTFTTDSQRYGLMMMPYLIGQVPNER